jgi:hypothetical protein
VGGGGRTTGFRASACGARVTGSSKASYELQASTLVPRERHQKVVAELEKGMSRDKYL